MEEKTHRFMERQYSCLHRSILPALKKHQILFLRPEELEPRQRRHVDDYFDKVLFPVLTPLAVDTSRPFPLLANKSLNIAVRLQNKDESMFAVVQVPSILKRFLEVPCAEAGPLFCWRILSRRSFRSCLSFMRSRPPVPSG